MSESSQDTHNVFISLAAEDEKVALQFAQTLTKQGIKQWNYIDNKIPVGDELHPALEQAIRIASHVAVILSPNAINSKYVMREVKFADQIGRVILPIIVEEVEIPMIFGDRVHLDARDSSKRAAMFTNLAIEINKELELSKKSIEEIIDEQVFDKSVDEQVFDKSVDEIIDEPDVEIIDEPDDELLSILTKHDVFIVLAGNDKNEALEFAQALDYQGISHWNYINNDIFVGDVLYATTEQAIRVASYIVVILSLDAKKSERAWRQIGIALQHDRRIIPILVKGNPDDAIPEILDGLEYIDARAGGERSLIFANIATEISKRLYPSEEHIEEPEISLPRLMREASVRGLVDYVETVASLLDRRARACIYAIDPRDNSLYMIAATVGSNNYNDKELKARFQSDEGIIGIVAETRERRIIKADHSGKKYYESLQSQNKKNALDEIGFMVAIPIRHPQNEKNILGVLAVDHPDDLWNERFVKKNELTYSIINPRTEKSVGTLSLDNSEEGEEISNGEFDKFLNNVITLSEASASIMIRPICGYQPYPLSFFTFHSLRYNLRIARRLPMFQREQNTITRNDELEVQSAIYYKHLNDKDEEILYILASSRGYDYQEITRQFLVQTQGIVGLVVRKKNTCVDNRDQNREDAEERGKLIKHLTEDLKMTPEQIVGVFDIKSIIGIPIFQPGEAPNKVIGVLTITSSSPMDESLLNHPSIIADAMRLANLASKLIASET